MKIYLAIMASKTIDRSRRYNKNREAKMGRRLLGLYEHPEEKEHRIPGRPFADSVEKGTPLKMPSGQFASMKELEGVSDFLDKLFSFDPKMTDKEKADVFAASPETIKIPRVGETGGVNKIKDRRRLRRHTSS